MAIRTIALALAICSTQLWAADLTGYTATYTGEYKGFNIEAQRELSCDGSICTLSTQASAFAGEIDESTTFTFGDNLITSRQYDYSQKFLMSKRNRSVIFADDHLSALYSDRDGNKSVELSGPTYDNLNYQLAVSLAALNGTEEIDLEVLRRGRLVEMKFKKIADEIININGESVDTVHFRQVRDDNKRQTDLWLAPGLQGVLVRLIFVEKGDRSTLELQSLSSHQPPQISEPQPEANE